MSRCLAILDTGGILLGFCDKVGGNGTPVPFEVVKKLRSYASWIDLALKLHNGAVMLGHDGQMTRTSIPNRREDIRHLDLSHKTCPRPLHTANLGVVLVI